MLTDLYPLLRTVQPAELNYTLNALATALEGRGEQLGENLETLDGYLKRLNPQIPALDRGPAAAARRSPTPTPTCCPSSRTILRNTVTTGNTLEDQRGRSSRRCSTTSPAFSDDRRRFLDDNGDNLIRLGRARRSRSCAVLAPYAPEYPCLLERHRQRRQAARPRRSAASPCTSSSRRCPTSRAATTRRTARSTATTAAPTACTCPTRRGPRATRCRTSPTSTTASTSPPARAPAAWRPGCVRHRRRLRRRRATSRRSLKSLLGPGPRASPPTTCPTSASCCSARWPAGRR